MPPTSPWKIRAPSPQCRLHGAAFLPGEVIYSCLTESPDHDGYTREDFCEAAWREVHSQRNPFCFWRSAFDPKPPPAPAPSQPLSPQDAGSLLPRLLKEDDPSTERLRYILALILERKKILRPLSRESQAGRPVLLYEHLRTGEVFLIPDPGTSLDQAPEIEREIRRWLQPQSLPPAQSSPV